MPADTFMTRHPEYLNKERNENMKMKFKRFLAMTLAVVMIIGMLPAKVLADDGEAPCEHAVWVEGTCATCGFT